MKTRKNKKGISLIVLVITIIVMIILAAAIIISISNSGIVNRANEAVDETNKNQAKELANIIWANEYLAGKRGNELIQAVETELEKQGITASDYGIEIGDNGISFGKTDTKDPESDFDENAWEFAYTYTSSNQEWSSKILATDGTTLTGDIIVKFYNNGERLTPDPVVYNGQTIEFYNGETYTMLIQGQGDMSTLMVVGEDGMPTNGYAWQLQTLMYMGDPTLKCAIIPFVTEAIIEEGITNIGSFAFVGATSLTKITIPGSVKKIEQNTFMSVQKLTTINVASKEEWNNTIIGQYNYELIDIPAIYQYRTKVERLANEGLEKAKNDGVAESGLTTSVTNYITANGVSNETLALYNINATTSGITVTGKETTLGETILNGADYGKTVNYTANGISDWKVLYKQTVDGEEYVYLIASENAPNSSLPTKLTDKVENGGAGAIIDGKNIYWSTAPSVVSSGTINKTHWLANWSDYSTNTNGRCITYFLDEGYWTSFKNATKYGDNVVGAIGTPTAEMIVASYNARSTAIGDTENSTLTLTSGDYGYKINGENWTYFSRLDKLYTPSYALQEYTWLTSPSDSGTSGFLPLTCRGSMNDYYFIIAYLGIRPVVSLKSSIPAYVGVTADSSDIVLK